MAFLKNKQFLEIRQSAKDGNEKANMIIQAMMNGSDQSNIDNLVNDYYNVTTMVDGEEIPTLEALASEDSGEPIIEEPETYTMEDATTLPEVDFNSQLEGELEGLLDENDIEDLPFNKFLENKKKDGLRSKKNNEYFKIFDQNGRDGFVFSKTQAYNDKFNNARNDIERNFRDHNKALEGYSQNVMNMLDDDFELDMNGASSAYDELTSNEGAMKSFGRHWDDFDNENMLNTLRELVVKYGKKNVIAALNTLKSDTDNYRNHRLGQIDAETNRYQKSLANLLK